MRPNARYLADVCYIYIYYLFFDRELDTCSCFFQLNNMNFRPGLRHVQAVQYSNAQMHANTFVCSKLKCDVLDD